MKTINLLVVLILFALTSYASDFNTQSPKSKNFYFKHEIGLNLFSSKFFFENQISNENENYFPKGITYKMHFGNKALRFEFDLYRYKTTIGEEIYHSDLKRSIGEIRVGIEKSWNFNKIHPFIACDLFTSIGENSITIDGMNDPSSIMVFPMKLINSQKQFGLSPIIGLKYKAFEHISFTLEASIDFVLVSKNSDSKDRNLYFDESVNLIRLFSVNYEFGGN